MCVFSAVTSISDAFRFRSSVSAFGSMPTAQRSLNERHAWAISSADSITFHTITGL